MLYEVPQPTTATARSGPRERCLAGRSQGGGLGPATRLTGDLVFYISHVLIAPSLAVVCSCELANDA